MCNMVWSVGKLVSCVVVVLQALLKKVFRHTVLLAAVPAAVTTVGLATVCYSCC